MNVLKQAVLCENFQPRASSYTQSTECGAVMAIHDRPTKDLLPKDYIISGVQVHEDQLLGEGAYGVVKLGSFYGLLCAVKKLKPSMFPAGMKQLDQQTELILQSFYNECEKMSKIRHPNVVQLLGVFSDTNNRLPVIVMELMEESLSRLLHRTKVLPFHIDVNIVHDVVQALAYLHSFRPPIVHRDLSSNNILLNESLRAKITDLGVAKVAKGSFLSWDDTPAPGTMVYMPPEVRKVPADLTPAMDIFAVGVNVIQIKTHKFPRPGPEFASGRLGFSKMVSEKERRRDHLDLIGRNDPVKALILDCIRDNPRDRPSAMKLCERLQRLKASSNYSESLQLARAKSNGADGVREQIMALEHKISQLTEELADQTSQVERLGRELNRERQYCSQLMEQNAREKLKYDLALASLPDSGIGATPTTCTSSSVTTATPTKATPKKRKRFKLKKFLRKSRDPEKQQQQQQHEKENKDLQQQTQSLPVNGKHPKRGSLQASGSHSPHGRHSRRNNVSTGTSPSNDTSSSQSNSDEQEKEPKRSSRRKRPIFNFTPGKLSETAETFVDITEVVIEEEDEEDDRGGEEQEVGPKPLSQRTKHDYKVNKLTWYTHNCLPVGLQGSTLQIHQLLDLLCVCGGVMEDSIPNKALLYCPIKNLTRWSRSSSDVPQYFSSSVVLQDEIVLIGGISAVDGKWTGALSSYDFNAHVWVQRYPPLPTSRSSTSAFVYMEYLVVIGGQNEQGEIVGLVEVLHLPTQVWETSARLAIPVAGASTIVCEGIVYLVGGVGQSACTRSVQAAPARKILSSCHRFSILSSISSELSPARSIWKQLHDCPFTKMTALCSGNQLLAFGGEQVTKSANAEAAEWIWIYDQEEDTWCPVQGMPSARKLCAVTILPDNNVVIIGGEPELTKIDIAEVM